MRIAYTALAATALAASLALAACQPPAAEQQQPAENAAPAVFPNLFQTAFRAEAQMISENGETTPVVMIRDGRKLRMEIGGQGGQTIIHNPDANETIMITSQGGQTMAMRMAGLDVPDVSDAWQAEMGGTATFSGPCTGAGEAGAEWASQVEGRPPGTACVTPDGIILRATENGRTTWETTDVQRGPQAAELFAAPAGVRVMDMSGLAAGAQRALDEAMKNSGR